jgi:hypothetical protein
MAIPMEKGRRHSGRPIYCFRDGNWLDAFGDPITDAAKVTERFRRIDYGHLEIDVTVDDPKANAAPKLKGKMDSVRPQKNGP